MIVTKDHREIELMAEAGRIVALVHEKLKEVIVPGITTKQIDEICEKVIRDNNATPSFLHFLFSERKPKFLMRLCKTFNY